MKKKNAYKPIRLFRNYFKFKKKIKKFEKPDFNFYQIEASKCDKVTSKYSGQKTSPGQSVINNTMVSGDVAKALQ